MPNYRIVPTLLAAAGSLFSIPGTATAETAEASSLFAMSPPELPAADREASWELPPLPEPVEAAGLINDLAAPTAATRHGAKTQLRALGLAAGPALLEASKSKDPELALSSRELLRQITNDHSTRRLHTFLVDEISNDITSNQLRPLLETIPSTSRDEFARIVFAMRHHLDPNRVGILLKGIPGREAQRLATWHQLIGHRHGAPLFLTRFSSTIPELELWPEHEAFLNRAAAADDKRLSLHARKWAVAIGFSPEVIERSALLDPDASLRNIAALRLFYTKRPHLFVLGRELMNAEDPAVQAIGLEYHAVAALGVYRKSPGTPKTVKDQLDPLAPFLKSENPRLRLRAAFGMIPSLIRVRSDGKTHSVRLDPTLLLGDQAAELTTIADWMEATSGDAPPPFPGGLPGNLNETFFKGLKAYSDTHMPTALRVLATDLVAKTGKEREDVLVDLANSLHANRFNALAPKDWPRKAFSILFESSMIVGMKDPLIYVSQEQFAGVAPAFLLPTFEYGPISPHKGYAMIAAANCKGDTEAIRILTQALEHPSIVHRMEAAMALSFLGNDAGRDTARAILNNQQASETIRSKAAVALASIQDEASYPAITKRFEFLTRTIRNTDDNKARARYLYALRDHRPASAETFVRLRLTTGKCPLCIVPSYGSCYCHRDAIAVAGLAYHWDMKATIPHRMLSHHPGTLFKFIHFLIDDEVKTLDFSTLEPVLPVPDRKKLDLRAEAAAKIDRITKGQTAFSVLVEKSPDLFVTEFNKWRKTRQALPFLPENQRQKLEIELRKRDGAEHPPR